MNSFELNKILGAILFTGLCILALNIGAHALFAPVVPAKPGYAIQVKAEPSGGAAAKPEPEKPIAVLLASADEKKGEAAARVCQACHTFKKGEPNKVGPNLWNIVGSPRGEDRGGFDFSSAMKSKGGKWTYEELNKFLKGPQEYIPGTKMTFAGLPRDSQRADVIKYLHTLSDNPVPLPKPTEAAAAGGGGAPAAGAAAPARPGSAPAAGGGNAPAKSGATPATGGAAPAKGASSPAPGGAAPAVGSATAPAKQENKPAPATPPSNPSSPAAAPPVTNGGTPPKP